MQNDLSVLDKAIIYINNILKFSEAKVAKIIETLDDVSVIFSSSFKPNILSKILSEKEINELKHSDLTLVDKYISRYENENVEIITIFSPFYPALLKEIANRPNVFFAKGNISLLKSDQNLAVVGTRRCTNYGQEVTKSFCRVLAKAGVCIVSGLADGIDSYAHKAALEVGGKTIAVMGSGFHNIYPSVNIGLVDDIIDKGGLIITQYELDDTPVNYHFPQRNRIVAGLSKGLLLIEAPARSGALITTENALEFNREIFVVPGRITDIYFAGSNEIIKTCQGQMVLSAEDILSYFGERNNYNAKKIDVQLSFEESLILDLLYVEDKHYEKLLIESNLKPHQLNSLLIKLELKNLIKKLPGNIFTSTKF